MFGDGSQCRVCFGDSFSVEHGIRICDTCGTQAGDAEHVQEAADALVGHMGGLKILSRATTKRPKKAMEAVKPPVEDVIVLYVNCLQAFLQSQLHALETKCGMSPHTSSVARQLWLMLVAQSGVLDDDYIRAVEGTVELHGNDQVKPEEDDEEDWLLPGDQSSSRTKNWQELVSSSLERVLHRRTLLFILYLSTWFAREAVLPSDIIRWALSRQLPYFHMRPHVAHVIEAAAPVELPRLLLELGTARRPVSLPSVYQIASEAANLAQSLGLPVPPINAPACLERFVMELAMPPVLVAVGMEMWKIHRMGSPLTFLAADPSSVAHAEVMAALLVAVKMVYGLELDPAQRPPLPPGVPTAPDWPAWARQVMAELAKPSDFPLTPQEAVALPDEQLQEYMDYLRADIFTFEPLEGLDESQRLFAQIGRDHVAAVPRTGGITGTGHLSGGSTGMDAQDNMARVSGGTRAAPATHAGPGGDVETMDVDGGEVPYRLFTRTITQNRALERLSPEYTALLAVAAELLWLTPTFLHKRVCSLETDIIEAEVAAASGDVAAASAVQFSTATY